MSKRIKGHHVSRKQADQIRELYAIGMRQTGIAEQFGISQAMVSKVISGWSPAEKVKRIKSLCSVIENDEPCPKPARSNGYCTKHYQRWKAHGDPLGLAVRPEVVISTCIMDDCGRPARNGTSPYCETHYTRWLRHGDPNIVLKDHTPAVERWKASYRVDLAITFNGTPCWLWTGPIYKKQGHGFIQDGAGHRYMAHRYVWEQIVGPIPKGMVLDHLCKNKSCVNPEHLEMVTQAVNAWRGGVDGGNAAKTHCDYGHEFTPENTYYYPVTGWRACRSCLRRLMREKRYQYAYVYLYRPGHPIADRSGKVQQHRMVLYDDIGPGPHPCHWGCGRIIDWGGKSGINVDHLNGNPSDNRRENLVASCQSCNKSRAASGNPVDWHPTVRT